MKKILFALCALVMAVTASAQQVEITVRDTAGRIIPGAHVSIRKVKGALPKELRKGIKASTLGVALVAATRGDQLTISASGYLPETIVAGVDPTQTTYKILLTPDPNASLEEVSVGFGSQKRSSVTSNMSSKSVGANETITNIVTYMQRYAPSVIVSGNNCSIRGLNSLNGGYALVKIDGVDGNIQSVNPGEITSVTVLKDASSTSIYGSKGAYGVILIKTKGPTK